MIEKTCPKCEKIKMISNFYKDKTKKCGYGSWCKECDREYHHSHREKGRIVKKKYRQSNKKEILERVKEYRKKYPEREKARSYLRSHRKELMESKCEVCNTTENLEGHHPDYSKLAWVLTLCSVHHKEIHMLDNLH